MLRQPPTGFPIYLRMYLACLVKAKMETARPVVVISLEQLATAILLDDELNRIIL